MPDVVQGSSAFLATYRVKSWTLVIAIECLQCDAHSIVTLINTTEASCPSCSAPYQCGGFRWDGTTPFPSPPQFAIAAGSPAAVSRLVS